jgi:hypothetical protein
MATRGIHNRLADALNSELQVLARVGEHSDVPPGLGSSGS